MSGFQTANSTYYVDIRNKVIWGGKLGNRKRAYVYGSFIVGQNGYAKFVDGGEVTTGVITNYI